MLPIDSDSGAGAGSALAPSAETTRHAEQNEAASERNIHIGSIQTSFSQRRILSPRAGARREKTRSEGDRSLTLRQRVCKRSGRGHENSQLWLSSDSSLRGGRRYCVSYSVR